MSRFKLKEIEIKSFRGIKNYILNFDDKSLVIVGENGSGKSSIVNAFEYLFTGKVESLTGKQSIKHDKALVHLGDNPKDLLVRVTVGKQDIIRTLDREPENNDFIRDFNNGSFLLNRQKLLSFIDSQPKNRFNRISSLIGFEELDNIENILRKTHKSLNSKFKSKKEELDKRIESLCEIYDCNDDEIYNKINEILSSNNFENINETTNLDELLKAISNRDFNKINSLNELMHLMNIDIGPVEEEYEKLTEEYEKVTLAELKSSDILLNILNKSSDYINNQNPQACPVCNQNINQKDVLKYIDIKKRELSENENILQNWKNEFKKFFKQVNELNINLKHVQRALNDFEEYEFNFELDDFINDLEKLSNFEITSSQIKIDALNNLNSAFLRLKEHVESDFEKLNNSDNIEDLNKINESLLGLKEKNKLEYELNILKKECKTSEITYDLFKDKKQKYLKEIITKIEEDVIKYYNFIHNEEEFNSPQINVPKPQAITLKLNFNNTSADPRTYSSEGHLDSLGLCIFLAFAHQFNKFDFLILDDIISTVDLSHKEKIAKLLFTEFKDYRFIITTHNKLWFRQLKNHAQNNNLSSKFNFVEIRGIGAETGPILISTLYSKEIIDKHIENGDTFAAGNAIRRYLESVLENVCKVNRLKLPLTEHLMIGNYFSAIKSFFNEMMKGEEINPEIKSYYTNVISKLDGNTYMGNLLSHNDDDNCFVSINEVENFKNIVYDFEEAMKCKKHKTKYLIFNKETKIVTCSRNDCDMIFSLKKEL